MADVNNDGGDGTQIENVFDGLLERPLEEFVDTFLTSIESIYEYDATEIQDFLVTFNTPYINVKFITLVALRQQLHESLVQKFPQLASKKLYNRRKTPNIVNDIYIIGYCIVNELEDSRLNKVLKNYTAVIDVSEQEEGDQSLLNDTEGGLLAVCVQLQKSVTELTKTVKKLQEDIVALKADLHVPGVRDEPTPGASAPNNPPSDSGATAVPPVSAVPNSSEREEENNDRDEVPTRESQNEVRLPQIDHNTVQPRGDGNAPGSSNASNADNTTSSHQDHSRQDSQNGPFQLQRNQRQRARMDRAFVSPSREEVQGQATRPMSIKGIQGTDALTPESQPRSVYVGRLSDATTTSSLRKHLSEVGIGQVSDIIDLRCKIQGQSSFCLIADGEQMETAIYNPDIWPRGAKIRPFKEKTQKRPFQNRNVRGNSGGPRLQKQNSARSSPESSRLTGSMAPQPVPQTVTPPIQSAGQSAQSQSPQTVLPWMPQLPRPVHPMFYDPVSYNRYSPLMWQSGF